MADGNGGATSGPPQSAGGAGAGGPPSGTSGGNAGATGAAGASGAQSGAGGGGGGAPGGAGSAGKGGNPMTGDGGGGGSGGADPGAGGSTSYPELTAALLSGTPARVAGGFGLAESPVWDPCEHRLLFADVQGGGGKGVINSLAADGTVSVFWSGTTNTNGFAFASDGSLILTQMGGGGHLARRDKNGMVTVLEPAGSPMLHTPDDLVLRSDGTIYFTDGDFCPVGNLLGATSMLPVYTVKTSAPTLVNSGVVSGPNGIRLSPDEKTLYVDGYGDGTLWNFSVSPDGSVTKPARALVTGLTHPDSLCLDAAGNLYVAVSAGLQVMKPDGTKIKVISAPAGTSSCLSPGMTNCAFGGDDGKTLYITNWTTVYKVDNMPIPGLDWVNNTKRVKCN